MFHLERVKHVVSGVSRHATVGVHMRDVCGNTRGWHHLIKTRHGYDATPTPHKIIIVTSACGICEHFCVFTHNHRAVLTSYKARSLIRVFNLRSSDKGWPMPPQAPTTHTFMAASELGSGWLVCWGWFGMCCCVPQYYATSSKIASIRFCGNPCWQEYDDYSGSVVQYPKCLFCLEQDTTNV